jgi:hypothetical protein
MIWPFSQLRQLRLELETERIRLAAVSVAAAGNFRACRAEWQSPALQDVLALRKRLDDSIGQKRST